MLDSVDEEKTTESWMSWGLSINIIARRRAVISTEGAIVEPAHKSGDAIVDRTPGGIIDRNPNAKLSDVLQDFT